MPKKVNKRETDDDLDLCLQKLGSDFKTARQSAKIEKQPTEEEVKATLDPLLKLVVKQVEKEQKLSKKFYAQTSDLLKQDESLKKTQDDKDVLLKLAHVHKKSAQHNIQFVSENLDSMKQASVAFFQGLSDLHQIQMKEFEELGTILDEKRDEQNEKRAKVSCKPGPSGSKKFKPALN